MAEKVVSCMIERVGPTQQQRDCGLKATFYARGADARSRNKSNVVRCVIRNKMNQIDGLVTSVLHVPRKKKNRRTMTMITSTPNPPTAIAIGG